jgi:hypothetical protein
MTNAAEEDHLVTPIHELPRRGILGNPYPGSCIGSVSKPPNLGAPSLWRPTAYHNMS